jgi:hypothetical protein
MRNLLKIFVGFLVLSAPSASFAQEPAVQPQDQTVTTNAKVETVTQVKDDPAAPKAKPAKKMIQDATINLQTTITGNQEQPRVLYILPWQSPQTENVDFEPLDNQQKTVFGHIEREELRRELESSGELQ